MYEKDLSGAAGAQSAGVWKLLKALEEEKQGAHFVSLLKNYTTPIPSSNDLQTLIPLAMLQIGSKILPGGPFSVV